MGHLGVFVRDMKEHLCWGARSALRIVCAALYLRGMYEYLINKSQAQGSYSEGAAASQNPSGAHPQADNMPSC